MRFRNSTGPDCTFWDESSAIAFSSELALHVQREPVCLPDADGRSRCLPPLAAGIASGLLDLGRPHAAGCLDSATLPIFAEQLAADIAQHFSFCVGFSVLHVVAADLIRLGVSAAGIEILD
jgi:hypothetical protein